MASCYFLLNQWDDVMLYLSSIKPYFLSDDAFNFNYGQALCKKGKWGEAEEALLSVRSEKITTDFTYVRYVFRKLITVPKLFFSVG